MVVYTVGGRSTRRGAFTSILAVSEGVETCSDETERIARGKTHWIEQASGPEDGLVFIQDISNSGVHRCHVVRLGDSKKFQVPGFGCACKYPEHTIKYIQSVLGAEADCSSLRTEKPENGATQLAGSISIPCHELTITPFSTGRRLVCSCGFDSSGYEIDWVHDHLIIVAMNWHTSHPVT